MRIFVTSSKDATVYNDNKSQNTGIDQILEVSKWTGEVDRVSRAFVDFDFTDVLSNSNITNATYSLQLRSTKLRELKKDFDLEIVPISKDWDMGLGKRQDDPITTEGVTWYSASNSQEWTTEGGDFETAQTVTFSYKKETSDLEADITSIVSAIDNNTIDNYGLAIKFTDAVENGSEDYGQVNYFSKETNTIYEPKVSVDWDDSTLSTGSIAKIVDADDPFVTITNLKSEYKKDNTYKFRLHCREKYPELTFTTGSTYSTKYYLPTGSRYSVVDNVTGETIVPFGSSSKLSVDDNGSYFRLNFSGWEAERYYKIMIKVDDEDGDISIVDKNLTFKLVE